MNTPGFSIFQSGESLKLDSSLNRAEEEEALEDQKRRQEELNKDLQNAFDDLIDDEDNTIDSSNYQSNFLTTDRNSCIRNPAKAERRYPPDYGQTNHNINKYAEEIQQLKMLLDSRTHELENVSKIAHEERKKREEIEKRLAISEAERERANLSKKSTHELLVESKEKCSNLENVIQKLKTEIKGLEAENNDLVGKLETSQTLLADVQHKYHMVEKNININNDRNAELKRKRADERHRAEIEMMQQQLDSVNNKLDKKTNELENMNTRYKALQHSHETMLIDKSSKINELSKALAEAQKQCEELMCKHDYSQENVRLQRLVADLQNQIQTMEKTIASLKSRLEQTSADLDAMDSVLQQNNDESLRHLSQTQGRVVGSTPMTTVDRVGHLKDELYRAMSSLRNKREEIRAMQQSLDLKNHEIKKLKDEENRALIEVNTFKEENVRLKSRLKLYEEELNELKCSNETKDRQKQLLEEIKVIKEEKELLQIKLEEHGKLQRSLQDAERSKSIMQAELKSLETKVKHLQIDLEEAKQERDGLKQNYEKLLRDKDTIQGSQLEVEKFKFLLKDSQKECDRLKDLYVEICNEKEAIAMEVAHLRRSDFCKELQEQKEKCASLNKALQLAEVKCSELAKILETQRISYEKDISMLREKLEKEKADSFKGDSKNGSSTCSKCIEQVAEYTKLEIQNLKLSNQCSIYKKEIEELHSELDEAKHHIADLSDKIVLIDEREKLIVELKAKAQQFEEYIKTQSSSGASSLKQLGSEDKSVETSPELESKANRRQIETKIRDEMAKIFANEIKNNDQRHKIRTSQLEEEIANLRRDLQKVRLELNHRQNEVQVLKHAILSEREKTEEMMTNKDIECNEIFQKQSVILQKCRDELKLKTQRISELVRELDERNSQIEAERQSMKVVMNQWEEHQKKNDNLNEEWQRKVDEMKQMHEATIALWQSKYNSAKKTALNYKRYSEDKENHMIKEYNRIKSEYEASLAKIEIRVQELFEKKNKEMKEAIAAALEQKKSEAKKEHSPPITNNTIS